MKLFKIGFALFLMSLIFSCSQDEIDNPKYFEKEFTIVDSDNNTFDIVIQSLSKNALSVQKEDIVIETFREIPRGNVAANTVNEDDSQENNSTELEEDEIYILVKDYRLSEDILGFSVYHKSDLMPNIDRSTLETFSYGSWGTRGAQVSFLSEEQGNCSAKYKLSRRNTSWFAWSKIDAVTLDAPGESAVLSSCTEYKEYRLRRTKKGWGCGWISTSYMWLTTCN